MSVPDPAERPPSVDDGLAVPVDMDAGRGEGLRFGLSLGGGGLFFVAWQVTYLFELGRLGVDLSGADRVVGTSAGSLVSTVLRAGSIGRLHAELKVLAKLPKLVGVLAPAADLDPSQTRALEMFGLAQDAAPDTVRAIGHAALAAAAPGPSVMPRNVSMILGTRRWPAGDLRLTCVDTYTGERCVVGRERGVSIARAVAASSAVPGIFTPQPILDRRCMDGGVSGSGIHVDLLAGAERVVVLCLTDGAGETVGAMTAAPGSVEAELAGVQSAGSKLFVRMPESIDLERLMDPLAVPEAIAMARRQAAADAAELRTFLA
jgi:NTE family protein